MSCITFSICRGKTHAEVAPAQLRKAIALQFESGERGIARSEN